MVLGLEAFVLNFVAMDYFGHNDFRTPSSELTPAHGIAPKIQRECIPATNLTKSSSALGLM
jgi:hypothetical protein